MAAKLVGYPQLISPPWLYIGHKLEANAKHHQSGM